MTCPLSFSKAAMRSTGVWTAPKFISRPALYWFVTRCPRISNCAMVFSFPALISVHPLMVTGKDAYVINCEMIFLGTAKRSPLERRCKRLFLAPIRLLIEYHKLLLMCLEHTPVRGGGKKGVETALSLAKAAPHRRSVQIFGMVKVTAADVFRLKPIMSRSPLNGSTLRLFTITCPVTFFTINRPQRTGKLAKHIGTSSVCRHCNQLITSLPSTNSHNFPPNLCINHRSCETAITGPGKFRIADSNTSSTSRLI